MSDLKNDNDDYNSSSDEDYDPEKDTEIDPQDEIDDDEGGDDEVEELSQKEEKPEEISASSSANVDVDALFAELTGEDPTKLNYGATSSSNSDDVKKEAKIYPKSISEAKTYPSNGITKTENCDEKLEATSQKCQKPAVGTKRVGLLDAAKTLSKKSKISVLERSDRDWKHFTTEQNIKEDLESHNRGKGGYLNKIDFLNRADNRQFEKERAFRATARKDTGN
uniref:Craniofacial development protein 1 n=1 Tax=Caenorhabditis japonica TaxID=281687 RepID=A0A8R1ITB5_CAEJA